MSTRIHRQRAAPDGPSRDASMPASRLAPENSAALQAMAALEELGGKAEVNLAAEFPELDTLGILEGIAASAPTLRLAGLKAEGDPLGGETRVAASAQVGGLMWGAGAHDQQSRVTSSGPDTTTTTHTSDEGFSAKAGARGVTLELSASEVDEVIAGTVGDGPEQAARRNERSQTMAAGPWQDRVAMLSELQPGELMGTSTTDKHRMGVALSHGPVSAGISVGEIDSVYTTYTALEGDRLRIETGAIDMTRRAAGATLMDVVGLEFLHTQGREVTRAFELDLGIPEGVFSLAMYERVGLLPGVLEVPADLDPDHIEAFVDAEVRRLEALGVSVADLNAQGLAEMTPETLEAYAYAVGEGSQERSRTGLTLFDVEHGWRESSESAQRLVTADGEQISLTAQTSSASGPAEGSAAVLNEEMAAFVHQQGEERTRFGIPDLPGFFEAVNADIAFETERPRDWVGITLDSLVPFGLHDPRARALDLDRPGDRERAMNFAASIAGNAGIETDVLLEAFGEEGLEALVRGASELAELQMRALREGGEVDPEALGPEASVLVVLNVLRGRSVRGPERFEVLGLLDGAPPRLQREILVAVLDGLDEAAAADLLTWLDENGLQNHYVALTG